MQMSQKYKQCVQFGHQAMQRISRNISPWGNCLKQLMCLQDVERRNTELEDRVQSAEKTLASSREEQEQAEVEVRRIINVLDVKICDLNDLRQSLAKLIDK